jgi:hypothetical protein
MNEPGNSPTQRWLDRFFESYCRLRPVNASFIGEHEYDHRLPDVSDAGLGDALAETAALLEAGTALQAEIDGTAGAEAERAEGEGAGAKDAEWIDRTLATGFLRTQLWEYGPEGSGHFHRGNPTFYTGEAAFGPMALFLNHAGDWPERIEAATSRMEGLPGFLDQARANVRDAPAAWTRRALDECEGILAFLRDGVEALDDDVLRAGAADPDIPTPTPAAMAAFRTAAARAAVAVEEHRIHLETDTLQRAPAGTEAPGGAVCAGEEAFVLHLRDAHRIMEPPADIVRYAESVLEEARAWLEEHAGDFGAATPAEAMARLADAHPEADTYYSDYTRMWEETRAMAEEHGLLTWPDFPIEYVPRPEWSRAAAPHLYFLFYRSPAAVHRPPVHQYLVNPLPTGPEGEPAPADEIQAFLRSNNDSVLRLNHVVHHGSIGHHVQNWHAFRAPSRVGRLAAVDCASRIAMLCGGTMAEGWACYATDLVAEFGSLPPLEEYAEVHSRARMACRAIVDVKLHCGEFGLTEAAEFYQRQAGMPESSALGEAVKNSMFPGGAVMYLLGTDTIHELRREWLARLDPDGTPRTLRAFHDTFLSHGSIPVRMVREIMVGQP